MADRLHLSQGDRLTVSQTCAFIAGTADLVGVSHHLLILWVPVSVDLRPKSSNMRGQMQCILPPVAQFMAICPNNCIRSGPQLTGKRERCIAGRALPPAPEAIFPPSKEQIEPWLVMGKGDFNLHLLSAGHAAMQRPGVV